MPRKTPPTALDLFSGAGGLSLGLHQAGWNVVAAAESDPWCVATYKRNFGETDMSADVRGVDFSRFEGIDLVAGGPPCQPFSVAGKQLAKADPRDMMPQFVRAVREARPRAFLLENVAGLLTPRHSAYTRKVFSQLEGLGYAVHWQVLDAASYGVPQRRRRLIVVGVPPNVRFRLPSPSHGPQMAKLYVTAGEALAEVVDEERNTAKVRYARNPVLRRSPWAGLLLNGKGRPIDLNAPSLTIPATAGGNRTHILDPSGVLLEYHRHLSNGGKPRRGDVPSVRRLTVRESARLQSFPDEFVFEGPPSRRYSQVGNAIPPLLAAVVARALLRALFGAGASRLAERRHAAPPPQELPLSASQGAPA